MLRLSFFLCLVLYRGGAVSAQELPQNPPANVAASSIQANVPAAPKFGRLLTRDLTAYFAKSTGKGVTVKYEPLRDGPTQTGVSFPKFYVWVRVSRGGKQIGEGAARVAAVEQKRFEVTDYLSRVVMQGDPDQIYQVFPRPVADKIRRQYLKH